MSKIIELVGAQVAANVQVKQQAAKLVFEFQTANANAADWPTLMARLNAVIVNVDMQNKSGRTETLIPKMSLGILAEIYSAFEGFIDVVAKGGADHVARFSVELGADGALLMDADTALVIDVTGMVAGDNLKIFAIDFAANTNTSLKTNSIRFNQNAAQVVGLTEAHSVHLPVASFDKIELSYPNGKVVTLVASEIAEYCAEGNQVTGILDGKVLMGYINYYSFNVADAISAKVTLNADANGYVFSFVPVF